MHHFRSCSIKIACDYVHKCWLKCLNDTDMIPGQEIKVSMNSSIHVLKLSTLKHFQNKCGIHTEDVDQDNFDTNSIGLLSATKLESDISMVNISDIQDNSDFNIADETMGDTHFKKIPSNDLLNLPEYKSLTLTIGNSLIIKKTSGNDIAPNHSSKQLKEKIIIVHYNHPLQ